MSGYNLRGPWDIESLRAKLRKVRRPIGTVIEISWERYEEMMREEDRRRRVQRTFREVMRKPPAPTGNGGNDDADR